MQGMELYLVVKQNLHPHTWEICISIKTDKQDFFKFTEVEKQVDKYISIYDAKLLNNFKPFHIINPTVRILERLCIKIYPKY